MPKLTARSRILTASRWRASALRRFESSTPGIARWSGGMIDGACDNGAREGAPSDFIDTGDQRPRGFSELTLDRLPPIPRHGRGAYSAAALLPVSGTATRVFRSLMRVALPVRLRR